jgi:dTDP-4-amino-4,6-dideoxygalactose transaminase
VRFRAAASLYEQKYIKEAFDTNWVAPLGPNVTGFEQDIEKYIGENSLPESSGTAAIHLGLILLGVKAGDEVLCQSMTLLLQLILFYI